MQVSTDFENYWYQGSLKPENTTRCADETMRDVIIRTVTICGWRLSRRRCCYIIDTNERLAMVAIVCCAIPVVCFPAVFSALSAEVINPYPDHIRLHQDPTLFPLWLLVGIQPQDSLLHQLAGTSFVPILAVTAIPLFPFPSGHGNLASD
jgi:hypothetical protein